MRIRRKTSGSWTPEKSAKAHAAKVRKRMEEPRCEPRRLLAGSPLGVLQWHAEDGMVRRWTIRQGRRMNGICVVAKGKTIECGWDRLFRFLRSKLAVPKRTVDNGME